MSVRPVVRPRCELFLETPASGRQENRQGGGVRAEQAPSFPGEGSASPPPSPQQRGGARGRGRGRRGSRGGGRFPPHPASRTTSSRCCPLPLAAASTEASGGAASVGTGPGTFSNRPVSRQENLQPLSRSRLEATWAQAARAGHMSLSLATSLGLLKTTGNRLGRSVARLSLRKLKYWLWGGFKGLPTAGTRPLPLKPFSPPVCTQRSKSGKLIAALMSALP